MSRAKLHALLPNFAYCHRPAFATTVKLGNKECFDKEQIGVKELFSIKKMPQLGVSEHAIVKISKKRGL